MNFITMKKNKLYWLLFLLWGSLTPFQQVFSQRNHTYDYSNAQQFFTDVNGRPLYMKVEYIVDGSPFHPDHYYKASLFLKSGKAYTGIPVKLNLMDNTILYTTPSGEELVSINPIVRVVFTDTAENNLMTGVIFERGFASVDKQTEDTYYEILDSGKVTLLKYYRVYFDDRKTYASATITRAFHETPSYYLCLADGTMKKLEKGRDFLLALINVKKQELDSYITREDLKCKKEADWKKVIAYYNSIL